MEETVFFDSWVEVGMAIAAIASGVIIFLFPHILNIRRKSVCNSNNEYPADFNWYTHTELHEKLTELRVQVDCARTQIVQFHNSGEFLDGISMKKMSPVSYTHLTLPTIYSV